MKKIFNNQNKDLIGKYVFIECLEYVSYTTYVIFKILDIKIEDEEYPYFEYDPNTIYGLYAPHENNLATEIKEISEELLKNSSKFIKSKVDNIIETCQPKYSLYQTPKNNKDSKFHIFKSHRIFELTENEYSEYKDKMISLNKKKVKENVFF